jgi:hypothetical protein
VLRSRARRAATPTPPAGAADSTSCGRPRHSPCPALPAHARGIFERVGEFFPYLGSRSPRRRGASDGGPRPHRGVREPRAGARHLSKGREIFPLPLARAPRARAGRPPGPCAGRWPPSGWPWPPPCPALPPNPDGSRSPSPPLGVAPTPRAGHPWLASGAIARQARRIGRLEHQETPRARIRPPLVSSLRTADGALEECRPGPSASRVRARRPGDHGRLVTDRPVGMPGVPGAAAAVVSVAPPLPRTFSPVGEKRACP